MKEAFEEGITEEEFDFFDFFGIGEGNEEALDYAIETNDRD